MMNPQIILNDGQTAVCRCPTSRDRTDLGSMTSMMRRPLGSAAALAAGKDLKKTNFHGNAYTPATTCIITRDDGTVFR